MSTLEFLKHVLMNESAFKWILDEKVTDARKPPYSAEFGTHGAEIVPESLFVDGMKFDCRSIVGTVVNDFYRIGSFVEYAAEVFQKSTLCFTLKQLEYQIYYLNLLFNKETYPDAWFLEEAKKQKEILVQFIDKLVIMPTTLSLILDAYWNIVQILQDEKAYKYRDSANFETKKATVYGLYKKLNGYVAANCVKSDTDLGFVDKRDGNKTITMDVLDLTLTADELKAAGKDRLEFLTEFYADLGYNVMAPGMWTQVFYSSREIAERPNEWDEKTNPPITNETATVGESSLPGHNDGGT